MSQVLWLHSGIPDPDIYMSSVSTLKSHISIFIRMYRPAVCKYIRCSSQEFLKPSKGRQERRSFRSVHTRIVDVEHEDIRGSYLYELVHCRCNLLLLDHRTDSNPALFLELRNRRCTLAGGDGGRLAEVGSGNVVLAQDVFLRRDNTPNPGSDELDHLLVGGSF